MTNLVKAVQAVMAEVKNIDKNLNVGTGSNQYKGVADKDVKQAIGSAMQKHGLTIFPKSITPTVTKSEWDEDGNYGKKHKMQVFTEVTTTYLLVHESGESIEIVGYGHGVDSQDKSAGKATTYALKNALLYTFLVPTGAIDDTDNTHSDALGIVPKVENIDLSEIFQIVGPLSGLTMPCSVHNESMKEYKSLTTGNIKFCHMNNGALCFGK